MTTHKLAKWLLAHEDVECGTAWDLDTAAEMDYAMVSRDDGAIGMKVLFGDLAYASTRRNEFDIVPIGEEASR